MERVQNSFGEIAKSNRLSRYRQSTIIKTPIKTAEIKY